MKRSMIGGSLVTKLKPNLEISVEHRITGDGPAALAQEWVALQSQHERYEHSALLIKLTGVVLLAAGWAWAISDWGLAVLMAVLWLQEGICRTSQSRLGERLLQIERGLKTGPQDDPVHFQPDGMIAFQLHSVWQSERPGSMGLLAEYAGNAARPTVAFPYVFLMSLAVTLAVVR